MKDFIKFCLDNFGLILSGLSMLLSFILFVICLFRNKFDLKKTLDDKIFLYVIEVLPKLIISAEKEFSNSFGSGYDKYMYVFSHMVSLLSSFSGLSIEDVNKKYGLFIDSKIEEFLSMPQKKEVLNNGITKNEKES